MVLYIFFSCRTIFIYKIQYDLLDRITCICFLSTRHRLCILYKSFFTRYDIDIDFLSFISSSICLVCCLSSCFSLMRIVSALLKLIIGNAAVRYCTCLCVSDCILCLLTSQLTSITLLNVGM